MIFVLTADVRAALFAKSSTKTTESRSRKQVAELVGGAGSSKLHGV